MSQEKQSHPTRKTARGRIYRYLHRNHIFCSKQDLAQALELSMPTVYQNVNELIGMGLVGYSGQQRATGGRSANGLAIVPDARLAVGISIMEDHLRLTATDLLLRQTAYRSAPFSPESGCGGALADELERFLDENRIERSRLLGVGVSVPGILSADSRQILFAPTLGLRDVSVGDIFSRIPYPVHIDNDANCGGSAEWFIRDHQANMAYLSLESGVGGAIFINNALYTGETRRSGEFGHMCVEPGGLACSCGQRGCLEAYCSVRRIAGEGFTVDEFFARVQANDPICSALWGDMLRHLAIGVNNIHMALDCDVILGGFLTGYLEPWFSLLQKYVTGGSILNSGADYLHLSTFRSQSSLLGAACHFVQQFINSV